MTKLKLLLPAVALLFIISFASKSYGQNYPVMYFCEKYTNSGETGISDRFTSGYLTVVVKADGPLGLRDVSIQLDKYNPSSGTFSYYKKFNYAVDPEMKWIYFSKNDESDMSFDETGIYRVFLLDQNGRTVSSALVEII